MNDIIKLILLNIILLYFLIKKEKYISILLIIILIIYSLYLKYGKILEGNDVLDEKKSEVKFMKMAKLDNLLSKLLNIYIHAEDDCDGEYTKFSPCDKKCGKTFKYKTFRVNEKEGVLGRCNHKDGERVKKECDISDGIYPCIIGQACDVDEDCKSGNCDPKTDKCVEKEVCSNKNLNLCNKEQCIDLNNQYSIPGQSYEYDESIDGVKCVLKDDETTDEETDDENNLDDINNIDYRSIINNTECSWYTTDRPEEESNNSGLITTGCEYINSKTIYLDKDKGEPYGIAQKILNNREKLYGLTEGTLNSGLYCIDPFKSISGDSVVGMTEPITENDEDDLTNNDICKVEINNINKMNNMVNGTCNPGYWPPLNFFKNGNASSIGISIDDICNRCDNGYKYDNDNASCTGCGSGSYVTQYSINGSGVYSPPNEEGGAGKINECTGIPKSSCQYLFDNDKKCNMYRVYDTDKNGSAVDPSEFNSVCCKKCPDGQLPKSPSEQTGEENNCIICMNAISQDIYSGHFVCSDLDGRGHYYIYNQ